MKKNKNKYSEYQFADFIKEGDGLAPSEPPECKLIQEHIDGCFKSALLNKIEETIVRMHYGLQPYPKPLTLKEIGNIFGKSREQVRQIEAEAIRKLERPIPYRMYIKH